MRLNVKRGMNKHGGGRNHHRHMRNRHMHGTVGVSFGDVGISEDGFDGDSHFGDVSSTANANCSILNLQQGDGEGTLTQWVLNVKALQQALAAAGQQYETILTQSGETGDSGVGDDGEFGPDTAAALNAFQAANGIAPSGVVDALTASKLLPTACVASAGASSSGGIGIGWWILGLGVVGYYAMK